MATASKPHAVCIPFPYQSHIKALLKFAKLLHHRGFHVTFVNTLYNHRLFLKSLGPNSLDGLPDFQFEAIPDGLPTSDSDSTQDLAALSDSILNTNHFLDSFRDLLAKLNLDAATSNTCPVTCIVADGFMPFSTTVAEDLGIPCVSFFTIAACGFMAIKHFRALVERGFTPLKGGGQREDISMKQDLYETYLTNGYLDTVIDWIPGLKSIRLRDLPSFVRTTDTKSIVFNLGIEATEKANKASAVVIHTYDELEREVLDALSSMLPLVYTIGPLQLLVNQLPEDPLKSVGYSLWKEETGCLQWLNTKAPNSVVYVNFGSVVVMTPEQLVEFGWGLANSKHFFLWVIRPDLVAGDSAILPAEFVDETKERGLIASWCPQEQVLNHPSVGGFLTHSGWNSTIESLSAGVPMICWPFVSEQLTNCWYTCNELGSGMEIDSNVKRDEVEKLVRELIEGEKGEKMRNTADGWKKLAEEATGAQGSSFINLDNLVNHVLLRKS